MILETGTTILEFEESFTQEIWDTLDEIKPDGRMGTVTSTVDGFGKISVWLDACSEGADRGGYVAFIKLHDIFRPDGEPIVLEEDCDGWLFEGRSSELQ